MGDYRLYLPINRCTLVPPSSGGLVAVVSLFDADRIIGIGLISFLEAAEKRSCFCYVTKRAVVVSFFGSCKLVLHMNLTISITEQF